MAMIWVIVHIFIMVAIGGSFLCIMTNELQITMALQVFLPITGIDLLLLIYFCYVVFTFARGDEDDDDDEIDSRRARTFFASPTVTVPTATTETKPPKDAPIRTPRKEVKTPTARAPPMQTDF